MRSLKYILNTLVPVFIVLIVLIIWTGGFDVHIFGIQISCNGLVNPILILSVLVLFRFSLFAGGKNSLTFIGERVRLINSK